MSYNPQPSNLDFEMGNLLDKAKGALNKVTEYTITKPSMMIGGAIGGKKGRELGKKIGGFTSTVTKLGVGAGAAGLAAGLAPALAPIGVPVATALLAKKALGKGKLGRGLTRAVSGGEKMLGAESGGHAGNKGGVSLRARASHRGSGGNEIAAKVAALLVAKLGGPINEANKAIKLAELQREATYEHRKLMTDADFRKTVLEAITKLAVDGDRNCQRTIKVLVGR